MLIRHINLKFLLFLNHYDLINKFCYKNFYLIPIFSKISLKIYLKGLFNKKLFIKYMANFILLYIFCFNFPQTIIKLSKFKNRRRRSYKVKLFLNYSIMKKKLLLSFYNLFFLFNKYSRPFFFSQQNFIFSKFGGKLFFYNIKIITFLPHAILLDSKENQNFLKKSKIFLTFTLKNILSLTFYNFFLESKKNNENINYKIIKLKNFKNNLKQEKSTKKFLQNFLLLWCLI